MSGGLGEVADVLDGIEHARRAGPRAHQDQRRRAARRERSHAARPGRALPRHRRHRALHRIHGCRQPQSLAARRSSCRRASWRRASTRAGPSRRASANYRGEVAERYVFEDGAGEIGFISSVIAAVLRRLLARAHFVRRLALHLPVRDRGHGPARPAARRRHGRRAARAHPRRLDGARAIATASCAHRCGRRRATCTKSR